MSDATLTCAAAIVESYLLNWDGEQSFPEVSENILDRNLDPLDATQATSPESRQGEKTPVDLPLPTVQGHGIRTGESIDPGAARSAAAGIVAASASDGPLPAASDEDLLGTIYVGKYELVSIIGSGGMGVIYQGRQVFLDRIVAIKMLKSNLGGERARMRFHQEAKASSQLIHPGIVSIIDFGVDELDRPYMVMEYVEGCTFSDLLRERQYLSVKDSLPIFLEICDALSIAHHKGVVHRDLKPSNIMLVVGADDKVHIKLLDFGIAKLLDMQEQTLQSMTKTGEALGTPLYMSPEQILGNKVTSRSDLYSLGCMMYACLTGSPPFVGANKLATMEKHCSAQPIPLKQASGGRDFQPGVEAIVMRLLEKEPQDRFDSIDQVKDALISMAVQSKLMPRPDPGAAKNGQLYLTGVIPAMGPAVADIVPRASTAQLSTTLDSHGRSETGFNSAKKTNSCFTGNVENLSSKKTTLESEDKLEGTRPKSFEVSVNRSTIIICFAMVVCLLTAGGIAFTIGWNSRKPAPLKQAANSLAVEQKAPVSSSESLQANADRFIETRLSSGAQDNYISFRDQIGLTNKGLHNLARFPLLDGVDLTGTNLTDDGVRQLLSCNLNRLILDDNLSLSDFALRYIRQMQKLQILSLSSTRITNDGLRYLAKMHSLKTLRVNRIRGITNVGIHNLKPETSHLEQLYLAGCNLSDDVASELMQFPSLVILDLSNNPRISDKTLTGLVGKSNHLDTIFLAHDKIGDEGIQALAKFEKLSILDLSFTRISQNGLKELSKMKRLSRLYLQESNLTVHDVQRLRNELQNTAILTDRSAETEAQ